MSRLTNLTKKLWKDELAIVNEDEALLKEMMAESGETYRGDMAAALRRGLSIVPGHDHMMDGVRFRLITPELRRGLSTHAAHPPMPGVDEERYPITWTGGLALGKTHAVTAHGHLDMIPKPHPMIIDPSDLPLTGMPHSPLWVGTDSSGTSSGTATTPGVFDLDDIADPEAFKKALMAKTIGADPIGETIKYLRKQLKLPNAYKALGRPDEFANLLVSAAISWPKLNIADLDDARAWAKVWTAAHGSALQVAMLGSGESLREVCERNGLALPGVAAVTFDEITDLERTLAPKSEHSSEAELARTLDQVALVEDPEYGVF